MISRVPGHPCDVLYVGRADLAELAELEQAGLRVARVATFVAALDLLRSGPVPAAVVYADAVGPSEAGRFDALRRAGAGAVLGVYPQSVAWRADRALHEGADLAVSLPAAPGSVLAAARRLVRLPAPASSAAPPSSQPSSQPSPQAPPQATPQPPSGGGTHDSEIDGESGTDGASAAMSAPREFERPRPSDSDATDSGPGIGLPDDDVAEPAPDARLPFGSGSLWLETVVADVSTMNRAVDHLDRLLDQVLATFARRADAERCSVLLYDRRRMDLHVRRTTVRSEPGVPTQVPPASLAVHVARSGRALLVADVAAPPEEVRDLVPAEGRGYRTPSCVLLPLRGVEEVVGVVCCADRRGGEPFRAADVAPLEFLAGQAGLAVENGLRFRHLQELAAIDELTGLANRRQFQAALDREVQRARRYERQVTLCLLDLDHFKQFNDLCGHQAGDVALATVGEILRTSLRDVDVVARYGGEEFALILPETSARPSGTSRTPFPFLERVRRKIEETAFPGAERLDGGRLTVSGGVACYPDDAVTVEELVREADRSLYVSKARGRNTITYRGRSLTE